MSDSSSEAAIVAGVDVSAVLAAIEQIKTGLSDMETYSMAAADAMEESLNSVSFTRLLASLGGINTMLDSIAEKAGKTGQALSALGAGGVGGVSLAGAGGTLASAAPRINLSAITTASPRSGEALSNALAAIADPTSGLTADETLSMRGKIGNFIKNWSADKGSPDQWGGSISSLFERLGGLKENGGLLGMLPMGLGLGAGGGLGAEHLPSLLHMAASHPNPLLGIGGGAIGMAAAFFGKTPGDFKNEEGKVSMRSMYGALHGDLQGMGYPHSAVDSIIKNLDYEGLQEVLAMSSEDQAKAVLGSVRADRTNLSALNSTETAEVLIDNNLPSVMARPEVQTRAQVTAAQNKFTQALAAQAARDNAAQVSAEQDARDAELNRLRNDMQSRLGSTRTPAQDRAQAMSYFRSQMQSVGAQQNGYSRIATATDQEAQDLEDQASLWGATADDEVEAYKSGKLMGLWPATATGGGGKKTGLWNTLAGNRHSPGGAFMYGMTVVPAFMAASAVMGLGGAAIGDMASSQDAQVQLAQAEGYNSIYNPAVQAQSNAAANMGAPIGYGAADMTQTLAESYRLTQDIPEAEKITQSVALLSRVDKTDPATAQATIAPIYKAFGAGAAQRFPDVIARASQLYDTNSADLEQALSKSAPIIADVGITTANGKPGPNDLEAMTAMAGTLMQNANLNPATAQSALRMFATNLRAQGKVNSLENAGFTDPQKLSVLGALTEVNDDYYGNKDKGIAADPGKATTMLQALAGGKSGMYTEELVKWSGELADNFEKLVYSSTGLAQSFATMQTTQTLGGQLSVLSADFSKMFNNPNSALNQAASGVLGAADSAVRGVDDAGTLSAMYFDLYNNKLTAKYDTAAGQQFISTLPPVLGGLASGIWGAVNPGEEGNAILAMTKHLASVMTDPKTPASARAQALSLYNKVMGDVGKGPFVINHTGGSSSGIGSFNHPAQPSTQSAFLGVAQTLSAKTGIPVGVIEAWSREEKGTTDTNAMNNNPLNVAYDAAYMPKGTTQLGNGMASFPTMVAGVDTTAMYINTMSNYAGVKAAATNGSTPAQIIAAIGQSPWDAGHYQEGGGAPGAALQNVYDQNGYASASAQPSVLSSGSGINYAKRIRQIVGGGKDTALSSRVSADMMKDLHGSGENPLDALAFLREEGGYNQSDKAIAGIMGQFRYLAGHGDIAMGTVMSREGKSLGQDQATIDAATTAALKALGSWGANAAPSAYSIVAQGKGGPNGTAASGASGQGTSATDTLLQQVVDNTAAANGYLNRMANFNAPTGYGLPFFEGWAAHTGATPSPMASQGKPASHVARGAGSPRGVRKNSF